MNPKNLFIFLFLISGFSSVLSKQNAIELAINLSSELNRFTSRTETEHSLDDFFQKITVECFKERLKETAIYSYLIKICDMKLDYYNNLITKKENNYKSILGKFSFSVLGGILLYAASKTNIDFTKILSIISTALIFGILGTGDLLDQIYAKFYYEKYHSVKEALEKQKSLPEPLSNPNQDL
jgi:hypothetical protein